MSREVFNIILSSCFTDFDQLPDPTVFDELPDDLPFTALSVKEEVKSPVSCDSQSVFSYSSASPPYSPSISEAGSRDYSTDEGIQSDFSDFEGTTNLLV